jgi:hypothetical protein
MEPRYALVYRDEAPVAAVAAQVVQVAATALAAEAPAAEAAGESDGPRRRRRSLRTVIEPLARTLRARALAPLKERVLVCGNLFSWGQHGVGFAPGEDPRRLWLAVAEALYRLRRAEKLTGQTDFILVKDLPASPRAPGVEALAESRYGALETEPDMVLDLPESCGSYDAYLGLLASKYRKGARKVERDVEAAGYRVEPLRDLRPHAARLHELYLEVHRNARLRLATLSPDYLPALAAAAGDSLRCTVIRNGGAAGDPSSLVGFVTTLRERADSALGYYIGFDRARNAEAPLYFRLLQAVVADALDLGCRRVSFGRTALEPKARLGARPVPMEIWLRYRVPVLNTLLRSLLRAVPHDEAPERNPFRD